MKTFHVPVYWTMAAVMEIEAETLEEAITKAIYDKRGLPENRASYVDDSFQVDHDAAREMIENDERRL